MENPKPVSWQRCDEFLGIGTGHLRGKPGGFRLVKKKKRWWLVVARGRAMRDLCLGEMQARKGLCGLGVSCGHEDKL